MRSQILSLLVGLFSFIGCQRGPDSFDWNWQGGAWYWADSLSVKTPKEEWNKDQLQTQISIRYDRSYPFSNFHLLVRHYNQENCLLKVDTIEYLLFDKSGNPLGRSSCSGYKISTILDESLSGSTQKMVLIHGMRADSLTGIKSLTVDWVQKDL